MPVTAPARETLDLRVLGDFEVDEVLYEAEEPVVFTVRVGSGQRMLAYLADHNAEGRWLVLAPCSASGLTGLRDGTSSVVDALAASWMWLAVLDGTRPSRLWAIERSDLPDTRLPSRGLRLLPSTSRSS